MPARTNTSGRGSGDQGRAGPVLPVVLGVAAVAVVGLLVFAAVSRDDGNSPAAEPAAGGDDTAAGGSNDQPELDLARREPDDPLALGDVDAPVVMIEYADFRCPFCGIFARETKPELVDRYVDDGTLRIEWRDLPVFGQQSVDAAVAGRAAARQGRFWEFYDATYGAAPERGKPDLPTERLVELAETAGVPDLQQFKEDLDDPELLEHVNADLDEAHALGATSTPVFLINDQPVVGAQPLEVFARAIEQEAAQSRDQDD